MTRVLLLLLAACSPGEDRPGTFVGNPGKLDVAVADLDPAVTLDAATVDVVELRLDACDGSSGIYAIGRTLDALDGGAGAVRIPGGEFCAATLVLDPVAPVTLAGFTSWGTTFAGVVDPGPLQIDGSFRVDGERVLVELSLAELDPAALEALGADVVLDPADPLAEDVASGLALGAALHRDVDGDGAIGSGDLRLAGDSGLPTADALSDSAGCGCATGGAAPWWGLILAAWAATRGSRPAPRRPRRPGSGPWPGCAPS